MSASTVTAAPAPRSCVTCPWAEWDAPWNDRESDFGTCAFPMPTPFGTSGESIRRNAAPPTHNTGADCRCHPDHPSAKRRAT